MNDHDDILAHSCPSQCRAWLSLHPLFSAYPLLGAYLLTAYTYMYKRMRLLTRVYGIVGHIPRKMSRNDGETYRTLLYNDRVLEMTLSLFYMLLSTSTKIFAGKIFRESVQTREKCENLHPAKITSYTVRASMWHVCLQ